MVPIPYTSIPRHPQNVGVFYFAERTDENVAVKINRLCIWNINPGSYRMYDSSYHHGCF